MTNPYAPSTAQMQFPIEQYGVLGKRMNRLQWTPTLDQDLLVPGDEDGPLCVIEKGTVWLGQNPKTAF
jgi:hypothetical protein